MSASRDRALYGITVFWSAVLLLLVQPMLTKAILPWFGGSAGVWVSSMLFYQALLLCGYAYAHLLVRFLSVRGQKLVHLALLAATLLLLPIVPSSRWKPTPSEDPLMQILGLLIATVGPCYFLLSSTSPLLQSWYSKQTRSELPYRLFAISNLGSLLALIAYPFAVEPMIPTGGQLLGWSWAYAGFALLCGVIAIWGVPWHSPRAETVRPDVRTVGLWLALAACPSVLWLSVANHLSQDVAAVPFLWVVPLGLYLLSFVFTFDHERWYWPRLFKWILPLAWVALVFGVAQSALTNIKITLVLFSAALFICCVFCHGELARRKPAPESLTAYYLVIAAGGALGGLLVGLFAPRIFNEYLELPLGLLGSILLALTLLYRFPVKRVMRIAAVSIAAMIAAIWGQSNVQNHALHVRNFYGTLQVTQQGSAPAEYLSLLNGTIQHGVQFLHADRSRIPTTYYGTASGGAVALAKLRSGPVRVGMVGLGVGTFATYGEPGDVFRFYEINPAVVRIANDRFRYLKESRAKVEIVHGDARVSMEREDPQGYTLLGVDAFSGDSIPVHLLTREAFAQYWRHVLPDGAVAIHVTNKHLDLAPVVAALAEASGRKWFLIHNSEEPNRKIHGSSWVVVTNNARLAQYLQEYSSPLKRKPILWTDDYSDLIRSMR